MRQSFTPDDARAAGVSNRAIQYRTKAGRHQRASQGAYANGSAPLTPLDAAVASANAAGGAVSGLSAGALLRFDSMRVITPEFSVPKTASGRRPGARRRDLPEERILLVGGVRCTDALQTLLDIAALVDDLVWEQALESALRLRLVTIGAIEAALADMSRARTPGVARIRRVLALRPRGAPPTESLLETLMVQLVRTAPGVPEPDRQVEVFDDNRKCFARVDLAWRDVGAYAELDGQQHEGQPVYDASRETAVTGATGWLCGRWTWNEVRYTPRASGRRRVSVIRQAERRPYRTG